MLPDNAKRLRKWLAEGVDLYKIEEKLDAEEHLPPRITVFTDVTDAPEHLPAA